MFCVCRGPVFPPGARVGMVPLVGLVKAKSFVGVRDRGPGRQGAGDGPAGRGLWRSRQRLQGHPAGTGGVKPETIETAAGLAYYTVESAKENAKEGAANVRRYSMILPGPTFSGYVAVQVPENASKIYTDDAVRQMFATAVIRNEVPVDEQLSLMPFNMGELSNFKNIRTLAPGAALILADGDEKTGLKPRPS